MQLYIVLYCDSQFAKLFGVNNLLWSYRWVSIIKVHKVLCIMLQYNFQWILMEFDANIFSFVNWYKIRYWLDIYKGTMILMVL